MNNSAITTSFLHRLGLLVTRQTLLISIVERLVTLTAFNEKRKVHNYIAGGTFSRRSFGIILSPPLTASYYEISLGLSYGVCLYVRNLLVWYVCCFGCVQAVSKYFALEA